MSSSFTLPMIIIGNQLATLYGTGNAICSILTGNLILWLIGIAVISMSTEDRSNALQNMRPYLGKFGAIFIWAILTTSLINWFVYQINTVLPLIGMHFNVENRSLLVRLGAGLGFFITLLSIGGFDLIKRMIVTSFPFIFSFYIYAIIKSDHSNHIINSWGLSLPAVISTVLMLFPGILNLPTLFRHAHSKGDCYLGLTVMVILVSFFEISTIWMNLTNYRNIESNSFFFSIAILAFSIVTLVFMNVLNIYFASICWETYIPRFEGAKGYVIIGLTGTATYTFIQVFTPILVLQDLTNSYLASLGTVLLLAYMVQIVVRHRPRPFEKILNGFCWLVGCVVSTVLTCQNLNDGVNPLLMGVGASTCAFLAIIFIEENVWAIRTLAADRNK